MDAAKLARASAIIEELALLIATEHEQRAALGSALRQIAVLEPAQRDATHVEMRRIANDALAAAGLPLAS